MGLRAGEACWYWTTLSVLRAQKAYIKIKPPAMIIGLELVSSFLMSTKKKTRSSAIA